MDACFPLNFATSVIKAFKVVMAGKINDNINTASRIINELYALVFVAITMGRSMRRRSMFGSVPAA
jgi:hypothetical protein